MPTQSQDKESAFGFALLKQAAKLADEIVVAKFIVDIRNDLDRYKKFFDKLEKDNKQNLFEGTHNYDE